MKKQNTNPKNQTGGVLIDINDINITPQIKAALLRPEIIACRNESESEADYKTRIETLVVVRDSTGPLKFNDKLGAANMVTKDKINLCTLIECYSRDPSDEIDELCKLFSNVYQYEIDDYVKTNIESIKVKKVENRYDIIDGRHRFVANIVKNKKNILVNIKEDNLEGPSTKKFKPTTIVF